MLKSNYVKLILLLSLLLSGLLVACGEASTATTTAATTPAATTAPNSPTTEAPKTTMAIPPRPITKLTEKSPVVESQTPTAPPEAPTAGQTQLSSSPALVKKASGETVNLNVEIARTSQEQQTGLMGRTALKDGTGMLFVFPNLTTGGFWMRNTLIPLSIAFIDQQGVILDIQDMEAQSDQVHSPGRPYLTALEAPQGYFARQGIKPGDIFLLVR